MRGKTYSFLARGISSRSRLAVVECGIVEPLAGCWDADSRSSSVLHWLGVAWMLYDCMGLDNQVWNLVA